MKRMKKKEQMGKKQQGKERTKTDYRKLLEGKPKEGNNHELKERENK